MPKDRRASKPPMRPLPKVTDPVPVRGFIGNRPFGFWHPNTRLQRVLDAAFGPKEGDA